MQILGVVVAADHIPPRLQRLHVDSTDGARLRIGYVELDVVRRDQAYREAARLCPLTLLQIEFVVQVAFLATPRKHESSVRFQVQRPQLMRPSHGKNESVTVDSDNVPRRGQFLPLRCLVSLFIEAFLTGADNRQHFEGGQIYFSDGVVLRIAHVDEVCVFAVDVAHALGVVELGFFEGSVD